jgi:hypothetical protein
MKCDPKKLTMNLDKQFVIDELKKQGESGKAQKALNELPAKIDHEQQCSIAAEVRHPPGPAC